MNLTKAKWLQEFKSFAIKGNVFDMAIGIIIGGAFSKIVTSVVNDIIMPSFGALIGGINFSNWSITIKEDVVLNIGNFIQSTIDFLIITLSIFWVMKIFMGLKKKLETSEEETKTEEVVEEKVEEASKEEKLLEEIRDILKKNADL